MRALGIALLGFIALTPPAFGQMEKIATICEKRICFHWWPKLPALAGWHKDREGSLAYSVNALAPDGSSFADAETVMYAKAIYKPRDPEATSLDALIRRDRKDFAAHSPGIEIQEVSPLTTADGQSLRSLTFFPRSGPGSGGKKESGNWERVSYGEEGDYYLVFTLSSRSRKGYRASLPAYERLVEHYREGP